MRTTTQTNHSVPITSRRFLPPLPAHHLVNLNEPKMEHIGLGEESSLQVASVLMACKAVFFPEVEPVLTWKRQEVDVE
jgi:hypothetical protein